MPRATLGTVLRYLRHAAEVRAARDLTDAELLDRFCTQRDKAAFTILVQRHGPMVLGVCRRILGGLHDAEDAFQATFLVLACKASSIHGHGSLAAWLHGVAQRVALKARQSDRRRRERERRSTVKLHAEPIDEQTWEELRLILDEELSRLPEKYRAPVVLCYLEGKTNEQAAQELGCPKSSLSSRLGRAREILRERLMQRGVTLSAGAVATALLGQTANAGLPALLVISTVKAATKFAAGGAAVAAVSAKVAALVEGGVNAMFTVKSGIATVFVLAAVSLAGLGAVALLRGNGAQPGDGRAAAGPPQAPASAATQAQATARGAAVNDEKKLEGRWLVTGFEFKGKPVSEDQVKAIKGTWLVTGNKVEENVRGKRRELSFKLDPSKEPRRIDLTVIGGEGGEFFPGGTDKAAVIRGIYRLKGDELSVCVNTEPGKGAPDKFVTNEDDAWVLYRMKRVVKVKADAGKDDEVDLPGQLDVGHNKMRNLGVALFKYVEDNGRLPSAAIYSKDGKPLLSWRVALLPSLYEEKLYKEFKLDEPWDSEHNKKLLAKMPHLYASPAATPKDPHSTFYQVLVGPSTAFPGATGRKPKDIKNFAAKVLVVEGAEAVPWTKPQDVPYDASKPLPKLGGPFRTGFYVLFGFNSPDYLKKGFDVDALRREIEIDR